MTARDARAEVRRIQERSSRLAAEGLRDETVTKPLHETTTVAVRLVRQDAEAIAALAARQGVPVSSVLRTWVLAGLRESQDDSVAATLEQLEQGLGRLRRALG